jgi:hypothetical protein
MLLCVTCCLLQEEDGRFDEDVRMKMAAQYSTPAGEQGGSMLRGLLSRFTR